LTGLAGDIPYDPVMLEEIGFRCRSGRLDSINEDMREEDVVQ
jgi:hypothetical protein